MVEKSVVRCWIKGDFFFYQAMQLMEYTDLQYFGTKAWMLDES